MTEIEARLAALEEKVFGISYPRALEVVRKLAQMASSLPLEQAEEILGLGDPEYTRAQQLIREVKRYVGKPKA